VPVRGRAQALRYTRDLDFDPANRTPERWQSGRMHRIRNPAYWFSSTEGSNPSLSANPLISNDFPA
jgi:hypothetical protein